MIALLRAKVLKFIIFFYQACQPSQNFIYSFISNTMPSQSKALPLKLSGYAPCFATGPQKKTYSTPLVCGKMQQFSHLESIALHFEPPQVL